MPRRSARRPPSCGSDSDSSSDGGSQRQADEALYRQLELAAALHRPADFAAAAAELTAIVRQLFARHCSKAVQALVVDDVGLAISCCDG